MQKAKGLELTGGLDGWQGEKKANVNKKLKDLIMARIVRAKKLGCDGIDPDNIDQIPAKDRMNFVKFLSEAGHNLGLAVGLKNGSAFAAKVEQCFDFVVIEECARYNECKNYSSFVKNGKAAFQIEYAQKNSRTCSEAKRNKFDLIFITNGVKAMNGVFTPCT